MIGNHINSFSSKGFDEAIINFLKEKKWQIAYITNGGRCGEIKVFAFNLLLLWGISNVKENGKITNKLYQEIDDISDRSASRDLENLVSIGVLNRIGEKKGAFYEINTGGYGG